MRQALLENFVYDEDGDDTSSEEDSERSSAVPRSQRHSRRMSGIMEIANMPAETQGPAKTPLEKLQAEASNMQREHDELIELVGVVFRRNYDDLLQNSSPGRREYPTSHFTQTPPSTRSLAPQQSSEISYTRAKPLFGPS